MRREDCLSNYKICNKQVNCYKCILFNQLEYLESRIQALEIQNADQAQLINSLVYKQHNEYMKFPF